jgi:hypothetical protein
MVAILLAMSTLLFVARYRICGQPLNHDVTYYAALGSELLNGAAVYSRVFDHKPMGIHYTFAIAQALAGHGMKSIFLLSFFGSIVVLAAVCRGAAATRSGWPAGAWAAAIWTIISGSMMIEGNQPNTELFVNGCLAWVVALFLNMRSNGYGKGRLLTVGCLLALASFYKHVIIVGAGWVVLAHFAGMPRKLRVPRQVLIHLFCLGLPGFLAWGLHASYMFATQRGEPFITGLFAFNRMYGGSIVGNLVNGLRPTALFPDILEPLSLLVLTSIVAIGMWSGQERLRIRLLLAGYAVGTYINVAMAGKWYGHYYQLWLPLLSIVGGWSVATAGRHLRGLHRWLQPFPGFALLAVLCWYQAPTYRLSPDDWSIKVLGSDVNLRTRQLGEQIDSFLLPSERIYHWGDDTGLYYHTARRPSSGYLSDYATTGTVLSPWLNAKILSELESSPPDLVIVSKIKAPHGLSGHPVLDWLSPRYSLLQANADRGYWLLYARNGSDLQSRSASVTTDSRPGHR